MGADIVLICLPDTWTLRHTFCKEGFPLHHCLFHSLYGIAMGLSSSMIGWPADFVQVLTGQGDEHCRTS